MEKMLNYISETPAQLQKNFQNRETIVKTVLENYLKKDYKRIVIITCGSSRNASLIAKHYMESLLQQKVEVVPSYTFLKYEKCIEKDSFYIGMGQSGRSTNTNQAMQRVLDEDCNVVGVCGNPDAEMKNYCNVICDWNVGIEKIGFVTKGVHTGAFFLMLFALEAAKEKKLITFEEYSSYCNKFETMINDLELNMPIALLWAKQHESEFEKIQRIQIVGLGPSYGVASEAALKMEEVMGKASNSYEIEEYLHGPCYELSEDKAVFLVDGCGKDSDRVNAIFNNINRLTPHVYLVTNKPLENKNVAVVQHNLDEYHSAFINLLIFQCIAGLVYEKWENPNITRRKEFIEAIGTKTQKTGKEIGL
jgi:glucoselysine-6-phosphate deglycase